MMIKKTILVTLLAFFTAIFLPNCTLTKTEFTILSGSENKKLEPFIKDYGRKIGLDIKFVFKGSVDIMLALNEGHFAYDAVWPANSIWINMGDRAHKVKYAKPIMTSPVVFGIKKSLAEKLGFVGRDVRVRDILGAIRSGDLRFMMSSATQSNSGTGAYLGFVYALLGHPEVVTEAALRSPALWSNLRTLLSGVHRASGSSGWLMELFLKADYDAMVNYESLIIETNQELIKQNREPLYIVYPLDGIVMADSPLGFVKQAGESKEEKFLKLQKYLLSKEVQDKLAGMGRRTGYGGNLENVDRNVFNPAWGVDTKRILSPIKMPSTQVIFQALNLYQSELRKPSFTVFCLDYSGSMSGDGERQLKDAMRILLREEIARKYMLQAASRDITIVVPFSSKVKFAWKVTGNNPAQLKALLQKVRKLKPGGETDIYGPVIRSLALMKETAAMEDYIPSVIVMTDGRSNVGRKYSDLEKAWKSNGQDIPVFPILFGHASSEQLNEISKLTRSRVFDGRKDLVDAFRKAKGYN